MKRHRALVAIVALLAFTGRLLPASADEGEDALRRGVKLFDSGELKAAERVLERATSLLPSGKARAQAYLHLGLTRAYQDEINAAKRDFARALADDPLVTVDPERVPPAVRNAFEEARGTVTGTVILEGGPTGARAEIDGQDKGPLPHRATLSAGEHTIRVLNASGKALSAEKIALRAGERRVLRIVAETIAIAVPTPPKLVVAPPKPEPSKPEPARERGEPPLEAPDPKIVAEPLAGLPPLPSSSAKDDGPTGSDAGDATNADSWLTPRRIAGLFTLSGSAVAAFIGLGFGLAARGAQDEFNQAKTDGPYSSVVAAQSAATDRARYANIFFGVGAGLAALGLGLVLWPAGKEKTNARLAPAPGGAMLAVEF